MLACLCTGAVAIGTASAQAQSGEAATAAEPRQVAQRGIDVPGKDVQVRRGVTVFQRQRPEVEPLGIRLGTFVLRPRVDVIEEYQDNIFFTDTNEEEDFITHVQPNVALVSDWANHELRFDADGDVARFADNGDEDYEDYGARASGRLDVRRSTFIRGSAQYRQRHESRSSPDDVFGVEPTELSIASADIEGVHRFNRLSVSVGAGLDTLDFDDVQSATGATINNDDRDRDEMNVSVRLGYEIQPEYGAFVRGTYLERDYDANLDDSGVNRDSDGYEVVGGVSLDFGGLTFGDFFAGYREQEYDDATLEKVKGTVVGADITWNVTPITTLIGTAAREVRETSTTGASGRLFTTFGVAAQHELLRNLLLGLDASYSQDDFEGVNRTDDIYRVGLSATYLLNRWINLSGGYNYVVRDSNIATSDFVANSAFVQLRLQY